MVKPIPKHLLRFSIQYEEFNVSDWGSNFQAPIIIQNVRLEPINAVSRTNATDDIEGSTLLFIDRTFSNPYIRLKERSKVTFDGIEYEVMKVNTYYDELVTPHHHEIILR